MNGYELRKRHRQQAAKVRSDLRSFAKAMEAAGVQRFYEEAYREVNGKEPDVKYKSGWFFVGKKRVSRNKLMLMGRMLWAQLHEKEIDNVEPSP